jgi:hypothetical protein
MKLIFALFTLVLPLMTHLYSSQCSHCDAIGNHDCTKDRMEYLESRADAPWKKSTPSGLWNHKDVPKRGWELVTSRDLGEDRHTCEMCDTTVIRYDHKLLVHLSSQQTNALISIFSSSQLDQANKTLSLSMGCICAGWASGHMDDLVIQKIRNQLINNQNRRELFPNLTAWKKSKKGNPYLLLKSKGKLVTIFKEKNKEGRLTGRYKALLEDTNNKQKKTQFTQNSYVSIDKAKTAVFHMLYPSSTIIHHHDN